VNQKMPEATPPHAARFLATAFLSGLLFAFGLALGGMTLPSKIVGFLDFSSGLNGWDPSLGLVMGGALLVYVPTWMWVKRRSRPLFDVRFHVPERHQIDLPLVAGAIIFGVGWGIAGFCPGPAFVSLGALSKPGLLLVLGMTAGILGYRLFQRVLNRGAG